MCGQALACTVESLLISSHQTFHAALVFKGWAYEQVPSKNEEQAGNAGSGVSEL